MMRTMNLPLLIFFTTSFVLSWSAMSVTSSPVPLPAERHVLGLEESPGGEGVIVPNSDGSVPSFRTTGRPNPNGGGCVDCEAVNQVNPFFAFLTSLQRVLQQMTQIFRVG